MPPLRTLFLASVLVVPQTCGAFAADPAPTQAMDLVQLGKLLFADKDLSHNRTQACATCHDPARGFTDGHGHGHNGAFSLGDDGVSLGGRNAPSVAYAVLSPAFSAVPGEPPSGGQFWDGRATDLLEQATGPVFNPVEMAVESKAELASRLMEKLVYREAFSNQFGARVWQSDEAAVEAFAKAIVAYETSAEVSPFDSRYDRFLRGEYTLTDKEELGRVLFFSKQFTNCNQCHQLNGPGAGGEPFSNYRYHNIGTPGPGGAADQGASFAKAGQFRVPSLRNVAVTGPYMHNGAFRDLRTVILFYNKYNATIASRQINPETGQTWGAPEVDGTLSLTELRAGRALDDKRIDALVAFLETLTDRRYEHLLKR
jgi:cytochrome c peroxidase